MNRRTLAILLSALALVPVATAQSADRNWEGIWQAHVIPQPTGTLTLASDDGTLGGTLVLDMIRADGGQPHVIASEPHVLLNPRVTGNTLTFQVKMRKPSGDQVLASFEVTLKGAGAATLHCNSCGPDAPFVTLTRGQ
jgi:hypothetical protein